jgi:hypothetical protein
MTLFILSDVLAKRGISFKQSRVDPNYARVYWVIDGASRPVVQVDLTKAACLELPDYSRLETKCKIKLADAEAEYRKRFRKLYKKS